MKLLDWFRIQHKDGTDNARAVCTFCGSDSMEISTAAPHPYQCWSCKKTGNAFTLMQCWYESLTPLKKEQGEELADWKKGTRPDSYLKAGVRYSSRGYIWPARGKNGHIESLYSFSPEENCWFSTPKPLAFSLLGLETLNKTGPIYLLEGHWDYAAFMPLVPKGCSALATAGSMVASRFFEHFTGRHLIVLFDADQAGQAGIESLASRMKKAGALPSRLQFLNWEALNRPTGYDIRDLVAEGPLPARRGPTRRVK